jgi:phenylacetate-CoA ligase
MIHVAMTSPSPPPFDAWAWIEAWNQTWAAAVVPGAPSLLRAQRLTALIDAATHQSPLYRERAAGARTLADFEPIDKPTLMARFDDWATDRAITRVAAAAFLADTSNIGQAWLGRYLLWTSSGTSGVPGWFVQDGRSLAAYDAIDALRLRGSSPTEPALGAWGLAERFAYVGATGGHFAGIVSMERLRRIVPVAWKPPITLHSAQAPLAQIAAELRAAAPTVLITYPSFAGALAQMQQRGELALKLRDVWVGGEQVSAGQRHAIEEAFGAPVRNNYGASECFSIAFQCRHGALHLNEDWVIAEPVDEHLRPVPPGVLAQSALITNLANRVQPLIRYRLDDRIRMVPGRCACGSPFGMIEVQGRNADTLQLRDAHRHALIILPLALETAIEEVAGVSQFQVIGHLGSGVQRLEVRFEPGVADVQQAFGRCKSLPRGRRIPRSCSVANRRCASSPAAS